MERFKDLSPAFQLVMDWRWRCLRVLISLGGTGRANAPALAMVFITSAAGRFNVILAIA